MKFRNLTRVAGVVTALMLPVHSYAATDEDAIAACTRELVSKLESQQGVAPKVRIANAGDYSNKRLRSDVMYYLDALEPQSQRVIARLNCSVDKRARVRYLRTLPLTADDARKRAQVRTFLVSAL